MGIDMQTVWWSQEDEGLVITMCINLAVSAGCLIAFVLLSRVPTLAATIYAPLAVPGSTTRPVPWAPRTWLHMFRKGDHAEQLTNADGGSLDRTTAWQQFCPGRPGCEASGLGCSTLSWFGFGLGLGAPTPLWRSGSIRGCCQPVPTPLVPLAIGHAGTMLLRYLRMNLRLFGSFGLLALPVMLPLNAQVRLRVRVRVRVSVRVRVRVRARVRIRVRIRVNRDAAPQRAELGRWHRAAAAARPGGEAGSCPQWALRCSTYGCSLHCIRLQPPPHRVAASTT